MKRIALILLAANLGVAAFFLGSEFFGKTGAALPPPLNVDRLSLRGAASPPVTDRAAVDAAGLCVEWRGLAPAEFARVRETLKNMAQERIMSFTETPLETQQWVLFPALPSRGAAQAKVAELRAAGVTDIFIVRDGDLANALSLGLYANETMARRRIRELEEKGMLGARIQTQAKPGTGFYFVVRSDDADALKSLSDIKSAYPESSLTRVACQN